MVLKSTVDFNIVVLSIFSRSTWYKALGESAVLAIIEKLVLGARSMLENRLFIGEQSKSKMGCRQELNAGLRPLSTLLESCPARVG